MFLKEENKLEEGDDSITEKAKKVVDRGCVSKQIHCTKDVSECRTFSHRPVADVFCTCTSSCLEVASWNNTLYNLQCDMDQSDNVGETLDNSSPFYCKFIPFLSYWVTKKTKTKSAISMRKSRSRRRIQL
jgi:hypothetical protein